jgi:hypothetical protein
MREVWAVLDEHRTAENLRGVLAKLREVALTGEPRAMKHYLDRVMGPVHEEIDLTGAPDEVVDWLAHNMGVR